MAQIFPRHREQNAWPTDFEAINEDFRVTVQEMEGRLNEHNWQADAITDRTDMEAGVAVAIHSVAINVVPSITQGSGPSSSPSNSLKVPGNSDWSAVTDMVKTIRTGNVQLWVMASCQIQSTAASADKLYGFQLALQVDGAVIPETITGGTDRTNDRAGEGMGTKDASFPLVTDFILPISAGTHTIQMVARAPRNLDHDSPVSTSDYYELFNRELIVLELR